MAGSPIGSTPTWLPIRPSGQAVEYDRERGITYWTKNYRTGIEREDAESLDRRYSYYDPIVTLPAAGRAWWSEHAAADRV